MDKPYERKRELDYVHDDYDGDIKVNYFQSADEVEQYIQTPEKFSITEYDLRDFIEDFESILKKLAENGDHIKDLSTFRPSRLLKNIQLNYRVMKRGPGIFNNTNEPFHGVRKFTPTKRFVVRDPRAPRYSVVVNQFFYDNLLRIDVSSKNYRNADEAIYFLEELINKYKMIFLKRGLIGLRYMERMEDRIEPTGNIRTFICGIVLYVRTFKLYVVYEKDLEELNIEVETIQN